VGNVPDERSPVAKAAAWAARILTVALEMVLPGLFGSWVDQKLGTVALFMLIGLGLGFFVATLHLMQMIKKID
jgi:F0F1-type ATP synthase assembly protein I